MAELDTPTKEVFAKLDHDRSGEVHYHEFLAATLEAHELLNEEVLQDTFDRMDHDDSGVISRENLRSLLGSRASDELVETLMQEGDAELPVDCGSARHAERVSGPHSLRTWRRCSGCVVFRRVGAPGAPAPEGGDTQPPTARASQAAACAPGGVFGCRGGEPAFA